MLRPQPKAGPGGEHQGAPRNAELEQSKAHPGRTRSTPPGRHVSHARPSHTETGHQGMSWPTTLQKTDYRKL